MAELEKNGAMDHTIVIVAGASDSAAFSFISPYSGAAIGEYFMDQGKDVLIRAEPGVIDISEDRYAIYELVMSTSAPIKCTGIASVRRNSPEGLMIDQMDALIPE